MTTERAFLDGLIAEATGPRLRMWNVDRFIERKKCKPEVAAKLRRLNPNGVEEGSWPRGYHRHARNPWWGYGGVGPREFVEKYGRKAYHALPKRAFIRDGHRKMIVREYIEDHFQRQQKD